MKRLQVIALFVLLLLFFPTLLSLTYFLKTFNPLWVLTIDLAALLAIAVVGFALFARIVKPV